LRLRFYCGVPLITQDGHALGSLCVVDFKPRELSFGQQEALRRLSRQTMVHLELRRQLLERNVMLHELKGARDRAIAEKGESDRLLLNILPASIAEELKRSERVQPRFFDSATVILIDFSGFTRLVETMEPANVIDQLDQHFTRFDDIMADHRLEKLKTIGDAYMPISLSAACRNPIAPTPSTPHCARCGSSITWPGSTGNGRSCACRPGRSGSESIPGQSSPASSASTSLPTISGATR
jgi:adenylate cyclase